MALRTFCISVLAAWLTLAATAQLGTERYRPHFHFTANAGYINDPCGLFYKDGVYHMSFQHDGIREKKWGYATSADLFHWTQHPDAIVPVPPGNHPVFTGSTVIDTANTSGLGTIENPPIVAVFSSWGEGQNLAYSTDNGTNWTRYANNPVLTLPGDALRDFPRSARDPFVMWDAPRDRWLMAIWANPDQISRNGTDGISFYSSPNLKDWTFHSHIEGYYVVPNLLEFAVDDTGPKRWMLSDWEYYTTGTFDGERFTPDRPLEPRDYGGKVRSSYTLSANQCWRNLPGGRTIEISWIRNGSYPGMPWQQQMSLPVVLSLKTIGDVIRLCRYPVAELESLYSIHMNLPAETLQEGDERTMLFDSESYDLDLDLSLGAGDELAVTILGKEFIIEPNKISGLGSEANFDTPLTDIRILADITTIEVFGNQGERTMSFVLLPTDGAKGIRLKASAGTPELITTEVNLMQSTWSPAGSDPRLAISTATPFADVTPEETGTIVRQVLLRNNSTSAPLNLTNPILTGSGSNAFSILQPTPTSIPAGAQTNLTIIGQRSDAELDVGATLQFQTNDPRAPEVEMSLMIEAAPPKPPEIDNVLMDPTTNDGSFESAASDNKLVNPNGAGSFSDPVAMGPVWEVQHNGGNRKGGWLNRDPSFLQSDGRACLFQDDAGATTRATSKNILGVNGYDTVQAGDTFLYSFDYNGEAGGDLSETSLQLSFDGGATFKTLGTGRINDADSSAYQTTSGSYVATTSDAENAATGGLLVRLILRDINANIWADNIILGVNPPADEPIIDAQRLGKDRVLAWPSVPGRTYIVEFCDDLKTSDWQPFKVVTATETSSQIIDSSPEPRERRYFRIRVTP